MYADDLVLLSPSLNALQLMIDQCKMSCESLWLSLSVGPAFKHDCVKVRLGSVEVEYVDMIKYLGVHICSASKFKLSYSEVKASFHRAVNGLLCKTKGKFDDIVMLRLVDAYQIKFISGDKAHSTNTDDHKTHTHTHTHTPKHVKRK